MKKLLPLIALAVLSSPALAEEKTFTITLTQGQVLYIGAMLGKQPFNEVSTLIASLQKQVDEQNKAASEAPAPNAEHK